MSKCSKCGQELSADMPAEICPNCMMEFALSEETSVLPRGADVTFGDYELIEEIARGGMGVVYKARQRSINRHVAIKTILAAQFSGKQAVQRFRAEAAAAGLLSHPNIVAIHEAGLLEGQPYFSMDYVEGKNLAQLVGAQPLPPKKAARYVNLVAEAIHYAHNQGILHRDLKPSNVLIDSATDQPRVTDFGLAKRLDNDSSLTLSGQVLGSPHFMPPEQASPVRGKVGRQSDVFGLGALLYYLLTARAPFQGETLESTLRLVLSTEPLAPHLLNPNIPLDLETICLKCLEKDPPKRYATAQALADDLRRFLNNEPISARPLGPAGKMCRWSQRNPALATAYSLLILFLGVILIASPLAIFRINQARKAEAEARLRAEAQSYAADMNLVQQEWETGDPRRARSLLEDHLPKTGAHDLRGFEWRYLWNLCRDESRKSFTNFDGPVHFTPMLDPNFLAVGAGHVVQNASLPTVMARNSISSLIQMIPSRV
jgi:tRNA A-37 threonylcarbamoyl transferase component Bud32